MKMPRNAIGWPGKSRAGLAAALVADADSDSEIGDSETCFDDFQHGPKHWDF